MLPKMENCLNFAIYTSFFWSLVTKKVKLGEENIIELTTSCSVSFEGDRYPIINSGDIIALRLAYSSGNSYGKYWLYCGTSYCKYTSCQGTFMKPSSWSSCSSEMIFKITAEGKMDGQPINSGDTVTFTNRNYGYTSSYHMRCDTSTSYKCRMVS